MALSLLRRKSYFIICLMHSHQSSLGKRRRCEATSRSGRGFPCTPFAKWSLVFALGLFLLALLAACGSNTSTTTQTSSGSKQNQPGVSAATATVSAIVKLITLTNQPKAKMLSGTTFVVDGMVKNGDSKQHDIYLKAVLLDTSGKAIATVIQNVDNVKAGATVAYAIQGTTPQPGWANVQVSIQKVTENTGGSGSD